MRWKLTTMLSRALGKTALIVFAALFVWNAPALAQDVPSPPAVAQQAAAVDPERLALAREVLEAFGVKSVLREENPSLEAIAKTASPDVLPRIKQLMASMNTAFDATAPELLDRISEIYAQNLTAQELRDTLDFYRSPSGQAFLRKAPAMIMQVFVPHKEGESGIPPPAESFALAREMLGAINVKSGGLPGFWMTPEEKLSPDEQRELDEAMPQLLDAMAVLYAKNLTEQEMKDILAFYRSSSGQSSQKKMSEINRQVEPSVDNVMAKMLKTTQTDYCTHRTCDKQDQNLFKFMWRNFDRK